MHRSSSSDPGTVFDSPASSAWPLLEDQAAYLSVLTQAPGDALKSFVDDRLLPSLPDVLVLHNASGLLMVPARDTAQGAVHHLGEVLVSEARVRVGETEGYGACLGSDLQQAVAVAVMDAAVQSRLEWSVIGPFVQAQARELTARERRLKAQVESTRVKMETF